MNIHVIQPEDNIYSIANYYGVSVERLLVENDIFDPNNLIVGEALVIIKPARTYIVQEGDSLESIAKSQGTDTMELLRNNPNVSDRELYVGEELVISYEGERTDLIKTDGFAYPFINRDTLRKTLPYLTYLTVYAYEITETGNLVDIDDLEIIQIAKDYNVVPIMYITVPIEKEGVNMTIAHSLISDAQIQNNFLDDTMAALRNKGYYGININTPFIQPEDRQPYVEFIDKITKLLNSEGYTVAITIAPSTFEASTGLIYEGVDYIGLGLAANEVLYQLTYAWRMPNNLPINALPFQAVLQTLRNATMLIHPNKCMLGISNVGYLWEFPFFAAIINARFINYNSAIRLASNTGSVIEFNQPSNSSFFQYVENGREYMVWFKDARSLYPWIVYSKEYGLQGVSIWNITYFVTYLWLTINAHYVIEKLI
jgi:spore germination protein